MCVIYLILQLNYHGTDLVQFLSDGSVKDVSHYYEQYQQTVAATAAS